MQMNSLAAQGALCPFWAIKQFSQFLCENYDYRIRAGKLNCKMRATTADHVQACLVPQFGIMVVDHLLQPEAYTQH